MTVRMLFTILMMIAQTGNAREAAERVRIVTQKQRERPFWFVLHGQHLNKIPFAYQVSVSRTQFEHNGTPQTATSMSWCSAYVDGRGTGIQCRPNLADVQAARRPPRNQKNNEAQRFWDEFRKAFAFEMREGLSRQGRSTTLLSFAPRPGYAPSRNDDTAIFPYIRGQLWIDDMDMEIARFEYEFFRDSSALVFGQVQSGTSYSMDLEKQLDGIWLPRQAATDLRLGVMGSSFHDESSIQFGNYVQ